MPDLGSRSFESLISSVSRVLLSVLKQEYGILQYFTAIKSILLLGQGEFFQALVEALLVENSSANLSGICSHRLQSLLDAAVRQSNLESLLSLGNGERLKLQLSSSHKYWLGLESYQLDFSIGFPCNLFLTEQLRV